MSQFYLGADFPAEGRAFDQPTQTTQDSPQSYARPALQDSQYLYNDANHMHIFGPASINSSSPVSLTFSSDGVSQVNQPSSLNTPSNSYTELARQGASGLSEQAQVSKNVNKGLIVKWVPFDASNPAGKKDKQWRKCLPCYFRKQTCTDGVDPTRCLFCKDSQSYCKGPITTPLFIDKDTLKNAAALAFETIKARPDLPMSDVWCDEKHCLEPQAFMKRSLPIQIPPLLSHFPYLSELPAASEMLDTLLAFGEVSHQPMKVGNVDLTKFENLCRRFCACLALLRNLHTCRIDATNQRYSQVHHQALGLFLRLSLLTNDLLRGIFAEIEAFCGATRLPKETPKVMGQLATFMGQILAEIRYLREHAQSLPNLPLLQIFDQDSATENALIFYGKTFSKDNFIMGSKSDSCCLPGVHFQTSETCSSSQKGVTEICSTAWPAMSDVLNPDFISDATRDGLLDGSRIDAIESSIQNDLDSCIPDADDIYLDSFQAVRRGVLISNAPIGQRMVSDTIEDELVRLQLENVSLRKLVLDKNEALRALTRQLTSNDGHDGQSFDMQCSPEEAPEHGQNEMNMLVQPEPDIGTSAAKFSQIDFDDALTMAQKQYLPPSLTETDLNTAMQDVIDSNASKEQRKRKRYSPVAAPMNQSVGVEPDFGAIAVTVAENASKDTSTIDIESPNAKLQKRTSTAIQLKKHFSGMLCSQGQQADAEKTSNAESGEPCDKEELKFQDVPPSEHRPKTWPLRQALRRSVDISVKTLVRGFEKLRA